MWVVLCALAYAGVPALLKWQLAKAGSASAGNPQVTPQLPQLKIKRLYIDAELSSLLRLAPVVDAIEVDAPVVSLSHLADGRYDMDGILARWQTADTAPVSKTPRFALYNLRLSGGRVEFADASHQKTMS